MTNQSISSIRNFAVIAHSGAGKTTLIESLLFTSGAIKHRGSSSQGKAAMVTEPEEARHRIAITNHVGHFNWKDHNFYFVDTPGSFNFLENTRAALPAVDSAVFLFTSSQNIKPETQRLWHMVQETKVPTIGFINQIDAPEADLGTTVTAIEQTLKIPAEPITFPLRKGNELIGIVNLITLKAYSYVNGKSSETQIPAALKNDLERARVHLIERIAENNDDLLEKYLAGNELTSEELLSGLKNSILNLKFLPLLCGAGDKDIGINILLEFLVNCMPSPIDRDTQRPLIGHAIGHEDHELKRNCEIEQPFSAQVLKTTVDPFFGKLSIVRVLSGMAKANQGLLNSSRNQKQKAGHTYMLQGKELTQVPELCSGQIGAIAKLEETHTGDTISEVDSPIIYPAIKYAEPPVIYAVESKDKGDEKVSAALMKLADEDPSLHFYRDEATHQMILSGMGQGHIDVTIEKLERKFGAHAVLKAPKVPYRETICKSVKAQGKLKKQTGGHGQFANTWLEVSPLPRGAGFEFEDNITGGVIPKQYIPSVKKGVQEAMSKGILGGFPVVDVRVSLYDGSFHDVDSSDYAFQVAGSVGFKAALEQADAVLLEPIMSIRITVPDEYTGTIIKDISGKRGKILGLDGADTNKDINALVPMAELLDYGHHLNSITSGRGTYTMHVSNYQEVPNHLSKTILEEIRGKAA